jgi:DNA repair exonuclease SbcCD ATPase subunit
LFFDEVFDALDADGVEAVLDVLVELAGDRAVVVISHNAELVRNMQAAVRLRVDHGTVHRE